MISHSLLDQSNHADRIIDLNTSMQLASTLCLACCHGFLIPSQLASDPIYPATSPILPPIEQSQTSQLAPPGHRQQHLPLD